MPEIGALSFEIVVIPDGAGHYLQLPSLTTAQRNALTAVNGMHIYNSTTSRVEVYDNGAWRAQGQIAVTAHAAVAAAHHAQSGLAFFGDGSDGDVDITSGAFSSVPITNNALTRDAFFDDLDLSGGDLDCAGYRLFVKGTLTIDAGYKIHRNGNDGGDGAGVVQGSGGAALAAASLGATAAGGNGGRGSDGAENGDNGSAGSASSPSLGGAGAAGGAGGTDGLYTGGTGAAGGAVTAPTAAKGGFRAPPLAAILKEIETTVAKIKGGSGGGGGGGGGAEFAEFGGGGGGGGSGGGVVFIAAKIIDNADGTISANGGDGGDGAAGAAGGEDGGGGGGGGGGLMILIYNSATWGTEQVSGGAAGTGKVDGTAGAVGTLIKIANA